MRSTTGNVSSRNAVRRAGKSGVRRELKRYFSNIEETGMGVDYFTCEHEEARKLVSLLGPSSNDSVSQITELEFAV